METNHRKSTVLHAGNRHKGSIVFCSADEGAGEVICNIRENGPMCGELADNDNRHFTTDNQKRMYMKPLEMGLLNMSGKNAEIALKDSAVLGMKTSNKMSLLAESQVELKGKNVTNPAIDRINSLNAMDIKNQAVKSMEQLLLKPDVSQTGSYTGAVPIDFSKVNWKAESHSNKERHGKEAADYRVLTDYICRKTGGETDGYGESLL